MSVLVKDCTQAGGIQLSKTNCKHRHCHHGRGPGFKLYVPLNRVLKLFHLKKKNKTTHLLQLDLLIFSSVNEVAQ